jgi:fatty-acyl-CoA synthase
MLDGRMMMVPLSLTHVFDRAKLYFPNTEIVSRRHDRSLHRTTLGSVHDRALRLARVLQDLGVKRGDRVGTLSWNHREHLESYLAIPVIGAVLHTLNLRLHPDELAYIAGHAGDSVVIVDRSLLPLLEGFRDRVPTLKHVIVIDDGTAPNKRAGDLDFETLLAAATEPPTLPAIDENQAAMICYTSGTTGRPKGVVFTHRSCVLHSLVAAMPDVMGLGERDVILPVVPMFHAAAWGLPFTAVMTGSKIVFPGPHLDPASVLDLLERERVTLAAGVPTVWLGLLALLDGDLERGIKHDLSSLRSTIIGGSAVPRAMLVGFAKRHGVEISHLWGMTEMSPLGTIARVRASLGDLDEEQQTNVRLTQGYAVPFVETRHVDEDGKILPWDGVTMGELEVRGPWVARSYLGDEGRDRFTRDGWFKTGDIVTMDADGHVRITDRSKDVVKSGGEWISSVALENALMGHPAIQEAAVFAAEHEKWGERPVAAIVFKAGQHATDDALRAFLAPHFAKIWLPDAFIAVDQVPRTSTGKFQKSTLRTRYGQILVAGERK